MVDAKSGEDLTRAILLQVILEEEAGGAPMFSADLLANMIRFYGNAMQGMMGRYVENTIRSFTEAQARLKEQTKAMLYGETAPDSHELWAQFLKFQGPVLQQMMGTYVEQSRKMFQQMQENLQQQSRKMFPGIYGKPEEQGEKQQ